MSCSLTDLANSIWFDLGQPSGQPPSYIQSRLVSAPYVGKLNNLLAECYTVVSGDISPTLGEDQQGIYSLLYITDYYTTQLNRTLQGINPGIISLRDGDSQISFSNPVDVSRMYRDARNSAMDELSTQVYAYRQMRSQPAGISMPIIVNDLGAGYPTSEVALRGYYRS